MAFFNEEEIKNIHKNFKEEYERDRAIKESNHILTETKKEQNRQILLTTYRLFLETASEFQKWHKR